jgi:TonB family protein
MDRKPSGLLTLIFAASLVVGPSVQAQSAPHPVDPAISQLGARIADSLQKTHAAKIAFADLKGPDSQIHPVGRWLADPLADSCNRDFPALEIILRPQNEKAVEGVDEAGTQKPAFNSVEEWARSIGANVVVKGTFARISDGIGISLRALSSSDPSRSLAEATGLVPISDEITALSPEPVPSPKGGIGKAGLGGNGIPTCVHCPPPNYTNEARASKLQGTVILQVTITTDGRAVNIAVVKGPGMGLEMKAIEAVRKWKFKPAIGPNGNPAAVIVPIEVTFRFY